MRALWINSPRDPEYLYAADVDEVACRARHADEVAHGVAGAAVQLAEADEEAAELNGHVAGVGSVVLLSARADHLAEQPPRARVVLVVRPPVVGSTPLDAGDGRHRLGRPRDRQPRQCRRRDDCCAEQPPVPAWLTPPWLGDRVVPVTPGVSSSG